MPDVYTTGYRTGRMDVSEVIDELAVGDEVRVNDQKQWLEVVGEWEAMPGTAIPHPLLVNDQGKEYALNNLGLSSKFVRLDGSRERKSETKVKELEVRWR